MNSMIKRYNLAFVLNLFSRSNELVSFITLNLSMTRVFYEFHLNKIYFFMCLVEMKNIIFDSIVIPKSFSLFEI